MFQNVPGISLSDDPLALSDFAGARFLAAIAVIVLLVVVEVFLFLPVVVIIAVLIAAMAVIAAIINVFLSSVPTRNGLALRNLRQGISLT